MHTHYSNTYNESLSNDTLVNDLDRNIHAKIVVLDFVVTGEICASQTYRVLTENSYCIQTSVVRPWSNFPNVLILTISANLMFLR